MALSLLFACFSGLGTTLLYVSCPHLSLWWLLPIWLGGYVTLGVLYILALLTWFMLLPKTPPSPRTRRATHFVLPSILTWVLLMLGMRVRVSGTERLPKCPFLLVGNHRSAFDPLCTIAVLKQADLVFVAKPGIFKIPVIGAVMRRLQFLSIDRENARNAVATIKQAATNIKDVGLSVGIYPEGTRSRDESLLPFHAGSFKIAKLAECPVAVVSIRYEKSRVLPWVKQVHIHVVEVLDTETVKQYSTNEMAEMAKAAIQKDLGME